MDKPDIPSDGAQVGSVETLRTRLKQEYDLVEYPQNGVVWVCKDGRWGCVDLDGRVALPLQYQRPGHYSDDVLIVKQDGKHGCVNKRGQVITPFVYDYIDDFIEGMAAVQQGGKWGFINTNGSLIVPAVYDYVWEFKNGVAKALSGEQERYLDILGRTIQQLVAPLATEAAIAPEKTNAKKGTTIILKQTDGSESLYEVIRGTAVLQGGEWVMNYHNAEIVGRFKKRSGERMSYYEEAKRFETQEFPALDFSKPKAAA